AVVAGLLAMWTKQVAVVLPVVALLYDRAFLAGTWRLALKRRWTVYAPLVIGACVTLIIGIFNRSESAGFASDKLLHPLVYAINQPAVIVHYVKLSLVPLGLTFDYAWQPRTGLALWLPFMFVAVVVIGGAVLVFVKPRLGFLPAAFFLILVPTSSVLPIADLAVEHRMYLPLVCILGGIVAGGCWLGQRLLGEQRVSLRRGLGIMLVATAAAALLVLTLYRNADYHHEESMWRDVVAKAPQNTRAMRALANVLSTRGAHDQAIALLIEARDVEPNILQTDRQLALTLLQRGNVGDTVEARKLLERIISTEEGLQDASSLYELGGLYASAGVADKAERLFEQAVKVARNDAEKADAWKNLATLYLQTDRYDLAVDGFKRSLEYRQHSAAVLDLLGVTFAQMGRIDEAADYFAKAVAIDPDNATYRQHLQRARAELEQQ
ncbi:MAG: tetratricopeptide repeat protein, partial [Rhodospirillales bacterium]|nr:tetratricopeptide repeat protein [Rhodospirillales bacterium]